MKEKLKSRKLWVAIGGVLTVMATEWLKLSPELAEQVIGAVMVIVPAYIGGQGIVDAVKAYVAGPGDVVVTYSSGGTAGVVTAPKAKAKKAKKK